MKTHDYTFRFWGHDYVFDPVDGGIKGDMMGWGDGLQKGDYLILENGEHGSRYQIDSIEYLGNPSDMWKAKVSFAPRKRHVTQRTPEKVS